MGGDGGAINAEEVARTAASLLIPITRVGMTKRLPVHILSTFNQNAFQFIRYRNYSCLVILAKLYLMTIQGNFVRLVKATQV